MVVPCRHPSSASHERGRLLGNGLVPPHEKEDVEAREAQELLAPSIARASGKCRRNPRR
jgi:hypothetical protein